MVSGVRMCVTADHNQHILLGSISRTAKYRVVILATLLETKKKPQNKKQPPTAKGEGRPTFSSVYTPRCQALTKHTYTHTLPPPMFRH